MTQALTRLGPAGSMTVRTGERDEALARYLRQIREIEPLTPEREHELFRRYHELGDRDAGERLVVANLMSVVRIARKYMSRTSAMLDLIQEGNLGLMHALEKFDPTRGIPFSAYARYWIRAMILRYVMENHRLVKVGRTRDSRRVFFQLSRERAALQQQGVEATPEQLAQRLGVDRDELERITAVLSPEASLDAPAEGPGLYDVLEAPNADPETQVHRRDLALHVREAVRTFSESIECEREQALLAERLTADDPVSLADLGRRFDVSRERMRQLEHRLKQRLRTFLLDELGAELEFVAAA